VVVRIVGVDMVHDFYLLRAQVGDDDDGVYVRFGCHTCDYNLKKEEQ
jgi:hypothetical protein